MASSSERPAMRYGSYEEKGGMLTKKHRHSMPGPLFALHKKRRYLRLTGSMLQVWKHEEDYRRQSGGVESEIGLQNCRVVGNEELLEIEIIALHRSETFIADSPEEYQEWFTVLKEASEKSIKDFYAFVKVLGSGHFGKVLLAKDHRTGESFAVKVIRKNKKELRSATLIQREMDILRLVNHKNVVRLYDLFDTESKLYFVLECMKGGVLYEVLSKREIHFSEERASHVLRDVLEGLEYLHKQNIVHRDIKPENILTSSKHWPFTSKLADFGLSNFLAATTGVLDSKVGTPYYCAREVVVNDHYGTKADLWSVGVLAYEMLSGSKPFEGRDSVQVLLAIRDGVYHFPRERWSQISSEARNFVESLICVDVEKRLSASEALAHPWIVSCGLGRSHAIQNERPISRISRGVQEETGDAMEM